MGKIIKTLGIIIVLALTSCSTNYRVISKTECKCPHKYSYEISHNQDTIVMETNHLYELGDKHKK